jgi:hypothetical protein
MGAVQTLEGGKEFILVIHIKTGTIVAYEVDHLAIYATRYIYAIFSSSVDAG